MATAYGLLVQGVTPLSDEGLRRSYLQQSPGDHAELLRAWAAAARAASLPPDHYTAHLQGAVSLQESVQRLVDTGLRLNEPETSAALLKFALEEVAELLGARRVLLVLEAPAGSGAGATLAGAQVPEGESATDLLAAITPWLDEARRTRTLSLRHGPEGADAIDQRSCLIVPMSAPMVAQQQLLGFLYADLDGLFGRFHATDCHLLATLAAQAAVALANLRTQEGLERQVAERTAAAEQRAAELALINRIQEGIAARLGFQDIVDLVGEQLRSVLGSGDLGICAWEEARQEIVAVYAVEHGQRLPVTRHKLQVRDFIHKTLVEVKVFRFGSVEAQLRAGVPVMEGTDRARSTLGAPLLAGERLLGFVVIENQPLGR